MKRKMSKTNLCAENLFEYGPTTMVLVTRCNLKLQEQSSSFAWPILQNKEDLIGTAKAIAKNGETLVKFAKILAKYCVDTK